MKILFVDDENEFTELASTLLDFHGIDVDPLNDPLEAEAKLLANSYDLLVSDLMMPQMNGFQLIEKVRSHAQFAKLPVIVLTAKPLSDEERKVLLHQDAHCMMKPFEPLELVEQIRQLVELAQNKK
jgi:DNA-binding response OmpR family regulator